MYQLTVVWENDQNLRLFKWKIGSSRRLNFCVCVVPSERVCLGVGRIAGFKHSWSSEFICPANLCWKCTQLPWGFLAPKRNHFDVLFIDAKKKCLPFKYVISHFNGIPPSIKQWTAQFCLLGFKLARDPEVLLVPLGVSCHLASG